MKELMKSMALTINRIDTRAYVLTVAVSVLAISGGLLLTWAVPEHRANKSAEAQLQAVRAKWQRQYDALLALERRVDAITQAAAEQDAAAAVGAPSLYDELQSIPGVKLTAFERKASDGVVGRGDRYVLTLTGEYAALARWLAANEPSLPSAHWESMDLRVGDYPTAHMTLTVEQRSDSGVSS